MVWRAEISGARTHRRFDPQEIKRYNEKLDDLEKAAYTSPLPIRVSPARCIPCASTLKWCDRLISLKAKSESTG